MTINLRPQSINEMTLGANMARHTADDTPRLRHSGLDLHIMLSTTEQIAAEFAADTDAHTHEVLGLAMDYRHYYF